jgi:hypothetical protein
LNLAFFHYAGLKKLLDEAQDVTVGDFAADQIHDQFMRNFIKEAFDIRIQHKPISLLRIAA